MGFVCERSGAVNFGRMFFLVIKKIHFQEHSPGCTHGLFLSTSLRRSSKEEKSQSVFHEKKTILKSKMAKLYWRLQEKAFFALIKQDHPLSEVLKTKVWGKCKGLES